MTISGGGGFDKILGTDDKSFFLLRRETGCTELFMPQY